MSAKIIKITEPVVSPVWQMLQEKDEKRMERLFKNRANKQCLLNGDQSKTSKYLPSMGKQDNTTTAST